MVKLYTHLHRYEDDPPPTVLLAFYLRYPNPFARHVLSCDVISREVDVSTGKIKTQRLILKRGIVPRWASKWLEGLGMGMMGGGGLEAWVLEESEVSLEALHVAILPADGRRLLSRSGEIRSPINRVYAR